MIFCKSCNAPLPEGARFCPMCATPVVISEKRSTELCPADYIYRYPDRDASRVVIPEGIDRIDGGYQDMKNLLSVTLPVGIKSIGAYSFSGCESLSEITLPEGLSEIDFVAFEGCTSLKKIRIPKSVELIDLSAFSGCSALERVIFDEPTGWGIGAFMSEPKPVSELSDPCEAARFLLSHGEDTVSLVLSRIKK